MSLRIAYFGTYDPGYPRNRVLIDGLRAAGAEVLEYAAPLDASLTAAEMATAAGAGKLAGELARAHLSLLARHRSGVSFDVVVVGYPGHLLVPLGLAGRPLPSARVLVFDPLVSLFDTFAGDRELLAGDSAAGHLAGLIDRVSFGLPDLVLADTQAHADYYAAVLGVPPRQARRGAGRRPAAARRERRRPRACARGAPLRVVQYGRWSPLHGLATVLEAADELRDEAVPVRAHRRRPARTAGSPTRSGACTSTRSNWSRRCRPGGCARGSSAATSAWACSAPRPRRRAWCPTRSTTPWPPAGRW